MSTPNTDAHAATVITMIEMAISSQDPLRRARYLSDAQMQLGWALRAAIGECQAAGRPWHVIGDALGVPKETVFRQYAAGGPVITAKPVQDRNSPGMTEMHKSAAVETVYAFSAGNGAWLGPADALPLGEFTDAALHFDPADPANPFAGQDLTMRFGPWDEGVTAHACQVTLPDGQLRRVRVTNAVVDFLFGDGQTPLRQAVVALTHAAWGNPRVPDQLQAAIDQVTGKMGRDVPAAEFITAVENVVALWAQAGGDVNAAIAMRRLRRVVDEYRTWAAAGSPSPAGG